MTDDEIALAAVRARPDAVALISRAAAHFALKPLAVAEEEFGAILDEAYNVDRSGVLSRAYMTIFREEWKRMNEC